MDVSRRVGDRFVRVMLRRAKLRRMRVAEALLIASLVWMSTGSPLSALWFVATVGAGALEGLLARRVLACPADAGWRRMAATGQFISALSFVSVAVVVMTPQPSVTSLAGMAVVLCAVALSNAHQSAGSRLATASLVTPPAMMLTLCPLWVIFAGVQADLGDTAILAVAGVVFAIFIVRLSGSLYREREALAQAAGDAEAGRQRWRMIFDNSPSARICFDASALFERLQPRLRAGCRIGDAARAEFGDIDSLMRHVTLIEANSEAMQMFGDAIPATHFAEGHFDAVCAAFNGIGEDGVVPPFEAAMNLGHGVPLVVRIHLRITPGVGAPWSLCMATYVDMTEAHRLTEIQREARRVAEDASRAKSEFLAVMGHEIRTPLNGVLGMAQAMDAEPLPPVQRDRLRVIRQSGGALMALLDDVLDIAQIESGRLALETHDFNLRAVVEGAHAAFAAEAAAKKLAFRLEIDPCVDGVWRGDSGRVRQLLSNLISNAVKFTDRGEVVVRLAPSASGVRLEVADTGIGIAPDRVARLFEKFAKADASVTRRYGGTGLGLTICQELCQAMGGAITVGSAPGQGSTFTLELPLRQVERVLPDAEPMSFPTGPADVGLRVLAAEDNPVNRMVLKALLAQFDVEATIVENGAEAVRIWESAHWDLILMDIQMPVMDGCTATMTIRAREGMQGRQRTPILAVTANTMPHQVASYRAAGMDDVIRKPLNVTELYTAMITALAAPGAGPEATARLAG